MIHIINGAPCSGKSTYAVEHAGKDDVIVDFDRLGQALGATASHKQSDWQRDAAYMARQAVIDRAIDTSKKNDTWIIQTTITPQIREKYETAGAEFITMTTTLEECLRRADADERPEGTRERIVEWFDKHKNKKDQTMRKLLTTNLRIKADAETGEGIFTAYASVFDNVDSVGDVVRKGAFAENLKQWEESGNVIPVYFGHRMDELEYNIGHVLSAKEDDHGLLVTCQLDLDMERGKLAYKLIKSKRLTQLSFAYDVLDAAEIEVDGKPATELKKLKIYEVSVVPVGANQATEFLDIKQATSLDAKAGRVLSQTNLDALKEARDAIDRVLASMPSNEEAEKISDGEEVKDEEPEAVKSEELSCTSDLELLRAKLSILSLETE